MSQIKYTPIGTIHTPFKTPKGTPIQPQGATGMEATVAPSARQVILA